MALAQRIIGRRRYRGRTGGAQETVLAETDIYARRGKVGAGPKYQDCREEKACEPESWMGVHRAEY